MYEALKYNSDPLKIKDSITSISVFDGIFGDITINKNGDADRPMFMNIIENGEIKTMGVFN